MNKLIQLATKPKRAAPKAKYIDPIVQGTFSQDGSLQEIVRALSLRMRDDNSTVVFKALIVLHTLLRSGSLDPTFSYLSSTSLSLSASSSDSTNLAAYGNYLAARIKAYGNLGRDVIRDKADRRATGRLRSLGVEGGLLREVREVQRCISALCDSKFYLDDVDDDVSMTALRLLVKDLLVLFTAVNEGVINVLEHYFEMSHPDATTALKIYKTFCRDTERVVAYLGVAKKMQNVLNVPVPNLKHAPVSLVKSLEEYLNDPNFAKNREEYKENKRIADGGAPSEAPKKSTPPPSTSTSTPPATSTSTSTPNKAAFTDFFSSIEEAQTSMFNPTTNSPSTQYFQQNQQQQMPFNPFLQNQMTGAGPFQPQMMPQMTGMNYGGGGEMMPNPFGQQQQQPQFLQNQQTGYLQPQMTGANPFRQSMMMTGGGSMGGPFGQQQQPPPLPNLPFLQSQPTGFAPSPFGQLQPQQTGFGASSPFGHPQLQPQQTGLGGASPFDQPPPQRQATLPLSPFAPSSSSNTTPSSPAPLVGQKTGTRNPFNPLPGEVVPAPKSPQGPSLNALAFGTYEQRQQQQQQPPATNGFTPSLSSSPFSSTPFSSTPFSSTPFSSTPFSSTPFSSASSPAPAALVPSRTGGLISNIASEFTFARSASPLSTDNSSFAPTSSALSSQPPSSASYSAFSQPTSSSSFSTSTSSTAPTPLRAQSTGFGGSTMKPFQPTSSFGSKLADELGTPAPPPVPAFSQTQQQPLSAQSTGFNPLRGSTLPPLNATLNGGAGVGAGAGVGGGSFGSFAGGVQQQPTQRGSNQFGNQFGNQFTSASLI